MLLRVRDLETHFVTRDRYDRVRAARALNGVSFDLAEGRILGLVGESGAGKSLTVTSILGLLRAPAKVNGRYGDVRGRRPAAADAPPAAEAYWDPASAWWCSRRARRSIRWPPSAGS